MVSYNIQFFGGRGSGGGKNRGGGGGGGGGSSKSSAAKSLSNLNGGSSVSERTAAINKGLSAGGLSGEVVTAAKGYPKGTVMTTFGFGGSGGSFVKTGAAGKDGWRNVENYTKTDTASILVYSNVTSVSARKRG